MPTEPWCLQVHLLTWLCSLALRNLPLFPFTPALLSFKRQRGAMRGSRVCQALTIGKTVLDSSSACNRPSKHQSRGSETLKTHPKSPAEDLNPSPPLCFQITLPAAQLVPQCSTRTEEAHATSLCMANLSRANSWLDTFNTPHHHQLPSLELCTQSLGSRPIGSQ